MRKRFIVTALIFTSLCLCLTVSAYGQPETLTAEDYFRRAKESGKKGDMDGIISNLTKAIELKPDYAEFYYERGFVYHLRGLPDNQEYFDRAIKDYTKAIELNPDSYSISGYSRRGGVFLTKKNYDRAIKDFTKAIELMPGDPELYLPRATAYQKKGSNDEAIKDFTKIIQLGYDNDPAIYFRRAEIYQLKADYKLAIRDLSKAIQLEPKQFPYYGERAKVYRKMGQISLAKADERKAAQLFKKWGL